MSSILRFSKAYPPNFAHTLSSHCQCFAHSFLFASQRSNSLASIRDLKQRPSTAFRNLNHLRHLELMQFLHISFIIPLFHLLQPSVPFLHSIFPSCVNPRGLKVCRQQFRNPPSAFSVHSSFWSDFPYQIFLNHHSLLLLHLFFCRWLLLLALPMLQVVFSRQGENSCPAIFSPLSYSVSLVCAHPPFQGGTSTSEKPLFCFLRPCTCPGHPPQFSQPNSSSINPFRSGLNISISSVLRKIGGRAAKTERKTFGTQRGVTSKTPQGRSATFRVRFFFFDLNCRTISCNIFF